MTFMEPKEVREEKKEAKVATIDLRELLGEPPMSFRGSVEPNIETQKESIGVTNSPAPDYQSRLLHTSSKDVSSIRETLEPPSPQKRDTQKAEFVNMAKQSNSLFNKLL